LLHQQQKNADKLGVFNQQAMGRHYLTDHGIEITP